ncbi:MAG: hypothetical protein R2867_31495 [Caldilineaceae bacterium]
MMLRAYIQEQFAGERPNVTMAELIRQAADAGAITLSRPTC